MNIPTTITAGDSAAWVEAPLADGQGQTVDSGSYALGVSLRGPNAAAGVDLVGTPSDSGWSFALTSAQSAALNTGLTTTTWYWAAYASKTDVRITAGQGRIRIKPNLAGISGAAYDGRSPAEQILAAIETELAARVSGGASVEYTIGTRSLKKEPMAALMDLRSRYRSIVARERRAQAAANGQGRPGVFGVRF